MTREETEGEAGGDSRERRGRGWKGGSESLVLVPALLSHSVSEREELLSHPVSEREEREEKEGVT